MLFFHPCMFSCFQQPHIDASSNKGQRLHNVDGEIELQDVKFIYPTREDVTVSLSKNLVLRNILLLLYYTIYYKKNSTNGS